MTIRNFTTLSALALGLFAAASATNAQPYGKGGNYGPAPAARPSSQDDHMRHMRDGRCDCSMMKGGAEMRDQCMSMMGDHHDETSPPRQPG